MHLRLALCPLSVLSLISCKTIDRSKTNEFHIDKALFSEVQKFSPSDKDKADVYLIDLYHYAPESFYWNIGAKIAEIDKRHRKTIVLEEGVSCPMGYGWIYLFDDTREVSDQALERLRTLLKDRAQLQALTENQVDDLLVKPGFYKKVECGEEYDNQIISESDAVEKEYQVVSQIKFHSQIYRDIQTINADILVSIEKPWVKLVLAIESCAESAACLKTPLADLASEPDFKKTLDYFQIAYRNDFLLKKLKVGGKLFDGIIIPWGENHNEGLSKLLEKNGYTLSQKEAVFYGKCIDLIDKPFFYLFYDKTLASQCFSSEDNYEAEKIKVLQR